MQESPDIFQTSLYLLSALLQADAALLGFGAIFVIYKLQSLETIRQSIIQTYYTKGPSHTSKMNIVLLERTPRDVATVLNSIRSEEADLRNYIYVFLIPSVSKNIKHSTKGPILALASHAIWSAVLLAIVPLTIGNTTLQIAFNIISVIWFGFALIKAAQLSLSLLTGQDTYDLKRLRPDVHKEYEILVALDSPKP